MLAIAIVWGFVAWGAALGLYRVTHAQLRARGRFAGIAATVATLLLAAAASRFAFEAMRPSTEPDWFGMTPSLKWWVVTAIAVLQLCSELVAARRLARAAEPPAVDAADAFRARAIAYEEQGKFDAAIAQYRAILQRTPDDRAARAAIADLEAKKPKPFLKP